MTRASDPEGYARFVLRHREQIRELLGNFGQIDGLEFDCEPRGTYKPYDERGIEDWSRYWPDIKETVKQARRLGPDVLFRERGIGSYGDFHTPEGACSRQPGQPR